MTAMMQLLTLRSTALLSFAEIQPAAVQRKNRSAPRYRSYRVN